jgi:hypothetical protein
MASTYGWVRGSRGAAHRCGGSNGIESILQTWTGKVISHIDRDNNVSIELTGDAKIESLRIRINGVFITNEDLEALVTAKKV